MCAIFVVILQVLDGDVDSSMKVRSSSMGPGGPSVAHETPSGNASAAPSGRPTTVKTHVAEIMTPSQAQATIDAFLRPSETCKDASSGQSAPPPAHGVEDSPMPRTAESADVNVGLGYRPSAGRGAGRRGGGHPYLDLEDDDIDDVGDIDSSYNADRLLQYAPERKFRRFT